MAVVGIVADGKWATINDGRQVIDGSTSDIDQIVSHLGAVVRLAQNLSPTDARRARDFAHAAQSMLSATTYLDKADQKIFERSLRGGNDAA